MKNLDVKLVRGIFKDFEEQLLELLNKGYQIQANIVIDNEHFLYAVLTKKIE